MARTSDIEVAQLLDTEKDLGWAVEVATEIVDEHLVGSGLSDNLLRRIEMFIAAHLGEMAETNGAITRESLGAASASYANIYGEGFRATRWGQQALALDYTGTLVNMLNPMNKAELRLIE